MPTSEHHSPYKGLTPYGVEDASFFFGRKRDTRLIIANLFASPLTLLYGASGVGKSSVLMAGVGHELRQRSDTLCVIFRTWQRADLTAALKAAAAEEAARAGGAPPRPSEPLPLARYLSDCADALNRRVFVILDQFEEYFLYHPNDEEFAAEFADAVVGSDSSLTFLVSLREDALAKLDRFKGRIPTLFDNYIRVQHLDREAAKTAITEPLDVYNRRAGAGRRVGIEPALVEEVLDQVQTGRLLLGGGRGSVRTAESGEGLIETPYLQLVMTRLWDETMRSGADVLSTTLLSELGGAERIVRTHLDNVMSHLADEEQATAAAAFSYLVTPSGAKIAHTLADLAAYTEVEPQRLADVLKELSRPDVRILRSVAPTPDQPEEPRYEIFHDVLAAAVLNWRARYMENRLSAAQQQQAEAETRAGRQARIARRLLVVLVFSAMVTVLSAAMSFYAIIQRAEASVTVLAAEFERERAREVIADANARLSAAEEAEEAARKEQALTKEQLAAAEGRLVLAVAAERSANKARALSEAARWSAEEEAEGLRLERAKLEARDEASQLRNARPNLADPTYAIKKYQEVIRLAAKLRRPADEAEGWFGLANGHREGEQAARAYERGLEIHGKILKTHDRQLFWVLWELARVYKQMGRRQDAIRVYERIIKSESMYTLAVAIGLAEQAELYREDGQPDKAAAAYEQLIGLRRQLSDVPPYADQHALGRVYLELGRRAEAASVFERNVVGFREFMGKFNEGRAEVREFRLRDDLPVVLDGYAELARLYADGGRVSAAEALYKEAIAFHADMAGAYMRLLTSPDVGKVNLFGEEAPLQKSVFANDLPLKKIYEGYAALLRKMPGRGAEAEDFERRAKAAATPRLMR